jgi:cyclase
VLAKRIIPCLDIKNGRTVKGTEFLNLRDAGDPLELAERYVEEGADELAFLDITASIENRSTLISLVKQIAYKINIPFSVGGGVRSVDDARALLDNGVEKVVINTAAVKRPELVSELAREFGSQAVVVAIDTREVDNKDFVYIHGGRDITEYETLAWAQQAQSLGAGEILLTSMNHDGTKQGFAVRITKIVSTTLSIPVIASGGAGKLEDFLEVFQVGRADAALAASVFHFQETSIGSLKRYLSERDVAIRL